MATKKRTQGLPVWAIILIVIVLAGGLVTCVAGFGNLFAFGKFASERTDVLVPRWTERGMPDVTDPIYMEGWNQKDVDDINLFTKRAGKITKSDKTSCSTRSSAGTGQNNGTFATCITVHDLETTRAQSVSVWKKVGDDIKLYSYNYTVEDEELGNKVLSDMALIERGIDPDNLPEGLVADQPEEAGEPSETVPETVPENQ